MKAANQLAGDWNRMINVVFVPAKFVHDRAGDVNAYDLIKVTEVAKSLRYSDDPKVF